LINFTKRKFCSFCIFSHCPGFLGCVLCETVREHFRLLNILNSSIMSTGELCCIILCDCLSSSLILLFFRSYFETISVLVVQHFTFLFISVTPGGPFLLTSICCRYGEQYASGDIRKYLKKVKNAQEAHEAIRPTSIRRLPCNKPTCSFVFTLLWMLHYQILFILCAISQVSDYR
jgi:hypothetical protein